MHRFIDFKSFRRAEIELHRPLTILVGPNGSGKSNALEGIEVLASIAAGNRLREITDLDREGALNVRGGLQGCPRYGTDSFALEFSAPMRWAGNTGRGRYSVTVAPLPEPRIIAESLFFGETMLFREVEGGGSPSSADIKVEYNNFAQGGRKPRASVSATRSVLSSPSIRDGGSGHCQAACRASTGSGTANEPRAAAARKATCGNGPRIRHGEPARLHRRSMAAGASDTPLVLVSCIRNVFTVTLQ